MQKRKPKITNNNKLKFKDKLEWISDYMFLKHPFSFNRLCRIMFKILLVILILFLFFLFLYKTGFISVVNYQMVWNQYAKIPDKVNLTSIITTQVSISFLVVSISSLISNIDNKYFFGESAQKIMFKTFGFFSFGVLLFVLMFLSILNIYFLITDYNGIVIILDFLLTIIIISNIVLRFARLFLNSNSIKKEVLLKYYKSNIKYLKKSVIRQKWDSKELQQLLEKTIVSIQTNDSIIYNNNIIAYYDIIKPTLFNYKETVQEYYTEPIIHNDAIAHLGFIAEELEKTNKLLQSLKVYNKLYEILNFFEVINISNHQLYYGPLKTIAYIKHINNELLANTILDQILSLFNKLFYQLFLFTSTDLSYCRLSKDKLIFYSPSNVIMEELYDSIFQNESLSILEKEKLYKKIQLFLGEIELSEKIPQRTVEDFRQKKLKHDKTIIYPVEIKAEPIALMILKMIENQDEKNIIYFSRIRLSTRLNNAIKMFVILSIVEILYHNNNRKYELDLDINPDSTIKNLKNSDILVFDEDFNEMINLYNLLADNYIIREADYVEGSYYGFHPKLRFSKEVLDTVFIFEMELLKCKNDFLKKIGKEDVTNSDVVKIIKEIYQDS